MRAKAKAIIDDYQQKKKVQVLLSLALLFFFSHYRVCLQPDWPPSSTTTNVTTEPGSHRKRVGWTPSCCH